MAAAVRIAIDVPAGLSVHVAEVNGDFADRRGLPCAVVDRGGLQVVGVCAPTTGSFAGYPSMVVSACEGDEGPMMSEQPNDRTAGTEEAAAPGGRDQWYGHLTVEDDPEGTTDEAELLRRYTSQDEA